MQPGVRIPGDWHDGVVPENVVRAPSALIETSYTFLRYRSEAACGLRMGEGAGIYNGTILDVGPRGEVVLGRCGLLTAAQVICDERIEFGDFALLSWNVIVMDSYRAPLDPAVRRRLLATADPHRALPPGESGAETRPVVIGDNVWIGFDACVLPGVTIGEGSVIGARSVVASDIPAYSVAVGNPARVVAASDRAGR